MTTTTTTTNISSPEQLIDELKKSGEFDRLRRELLTQFQRSERIAGFRSRVYDIARERLGSDPDLLNLSHDAVYRELMGEIDRYPVLERAVADASPLSDPSFAETIRASVEQILEQNRSLSEHRNHGERRDLG